MSIRAKIAITIVLFVLLASGAVYYLSGAVMQANLETAADEALAEAQQRFDFLEAQDIQKLQVANDLLRSRSDLQELFVSGDREALYEASAPLFESIKESYSITHLYYENAEPSSTVFLRVHNKDKYDDVVGRDTYVAAVETQSYGAGKDLGKTAFALRVVHPWEDADGNVVGSLEVGQEIESFLDVMSEQTGDELALLLAKESLDGEQWAIMRENSGEENDWDENETFVVAHSTAEQIDAEDYADVDLQELGGETVYYRSEVENGKDYIVGAFPVENTKGEVVGAVLVEHDASAVTAQLKTMRGRVIGVVVVMGLVLLFVVLGMLNSLVFKRLNAMTEHMTDASLKFAGGDFDVELPDVKSTDEIGSFEKFFNDFLGVVGNTLKQLSGK